MHNIHCSLDRKYLQNSSNSLKERHQLQEKLTILIILMDISHDNIVHLNRFLY